MPGRLDASSCPAYRGCERLRGLSGPPSSGCGSARTHSRRRTGCFTVTRSSDWRAGLGWSVRSRVVCRASRPRRRSRVLLRRRIVGGPAGSRQAMRRARRCRVCSIGQAVPVIHPCSSRRSSLSGSATAAARLVRGHALSPARPASRIQRSGRCSSGPGSRGRPERSGSRPTATSGLAPAISCTWIQANTSAFNGQGTASPETARARTVSIETWTDIVHAIVDDHSRLAYAELHADEKAPTVTGFLERALAFYASHQITPQTADDRQRNAVRPQQADQTAPRFPQHPPPHNPALPAPHQRKGRTLPPNHGTRMGLRPRLPLTSTP